MQWYMWAYVRRSCAGDVISTRQRGRVPDGTVWGGRVRERYERQCWGGGGHRAWSIWKSYKLFSAEASYAEQFLWFEIDFDEFNERR